MPTIQPGSSIDAVIEQLNDGIVDDRLDSVESGGPLDTLRVRSTAARSSQQNPAYITPAGTVVVESSADGYFVIGDDIGVDYIPGGNTRVANLLVDASTGRVTMRSVEFLEVNDPPDIAPARAGGPSMMAAEDAIVPFTTLRMGYVGTALDLLAAARTLKTTLNSGTSIKFDFTAVEVAASTTTSGAQTLTRDVPGPLVVVDGSAFPNADTCIRVEGWDVRYTSRTGNTLGGARLVRSGAITSANIPTGSIVSQHRITGITNIRKASDGTPVVSGTLGNTQTVEQNNFPFPLSGDRDKLAGLPGNGVCVGRINPRAWTTAQGVPAGSQGGGRVANIGAHIAFYTAAPPRTDTVSLHIAMGTSRLGGTDPVNQFGLNVFGEAIVGPENKTGPNSLAYRPDGRFEVINEHDAADTASDTRAVIAGKSHAEQTGPLMRLRDSADLTRWEVGLAGTARTYHTDGVKWVGLAASSTDGAVDTYLAAHPLILKTGGVARVTITPDSVAVPRATSLKWRNQANSADLAAIGLNSSNQLLLGADDAIVQTIVYGDVRFYDSVAAGVNTFLLDVPGKEWTTYLAGTHRYFNADNSVNSSVKDAGGAGKTKWQLTAAGVKIAAGTDGLAFHGVGLTPRPSALTQTYATATRTHNDPTAAPVATTAAALASYGFAQAQADAIVASVNALVVDVANVKQFVNTIADDLQLVGLEA